MAASGGAHLKLACPVHILWPRKEATLMRKRLLGKTGLHISELGPLPAKIAQHLDERAGMTSFRPFEEPGARKRT